MDAALLTAFRYDDPGPLTRRLSRGALRLPARRPKHTRDLRRIRS